MQSGVELDTGGTTTKRTILKRKLDALLMSTQVCQAQGNKHPWAHNLTFDLLNIMTHIAYFGAGANTLNQIK